MGRIGLLTFAMMLAAVSSAHGQTITDTLIITPFDNVPRFVAQTGVKFTVANGNWNVGATWNGGTVPIATDDVRITHDVTLTNGTTDADAIEVGSGGELIFTRSGTTTLRVLDLQVLPGGLLDIGTAASPITGTATLEINNAALRTGTVAAPGVDPEQYGNGLAVWGTITTHGTVKSPFHRVTGELSAGATTVTLTASPTGWAAGDRIIIPDTRQIPLTAKQPIFTSQGEERTITDVTGAVVTFSPALTYSHLGPRDQSAVLETGMLFHVANLTRNVTIRSAVPTGVRGHAIFFHRADVDLRYTTWHGLGRSTSQSLNNTTFDGGGAVTAIGTNQVGKYSIHMHHLWGPINTANPFTADSGADTFSDTAHGLSANEIVVLTTTGSLPGATPALAIETPYYVVSPTADTFKIALTQGGSAIDLTSNGSSSNWRRAYQAEVVGNVVENFTRWGLTVHDTHYALVQDNVCYNGIGSTVNAANGRAAGAIATEEGNESYNVFDHNFVMHTEAGTQQKIHGTAGINQGGISGNNIGRSREGFWMRGQHNYIRNNVVCNCPDFGYNFNGIDLNAILNVPDFRGADMQNEAEMTQYNISGIQVAGVVVGLKLGLPNLQFDDNEVYGAVGAGIWISRPQASSNQLTARYQAWVMDDTFAWHCTCAGLFDWGADAKTTFSDFKYRGDATQSAAGTSVETALPALIHNVGMTWGATYYGTVLHSIVRPDIQGCNVGIQAPFNFDDGDTRYDQGPLTIQDPILKNHINLEVRFARQGNGQLITVDNMVSALITARGPVTVPATPAHIWAHADQTDPHTKEMTPCTYNFTDYQGTPGNDFRVYYLEQAPDFIVPPYHEDRGFADPNAPGVGLTMQQCWDTYGIAFGGGIRPATATDGISQSIIGFVDDTDPPTDPSVILTVNNTQISETSGVATVTATLSFANDVTTTINLGFAGTATNTTDYTRSGESIVITAGNTTGTRTVNAVSDATDESNETVIVSITSVVNGTENGVQSVTTTIIDDDTPTPDPTVSMVADVTTISELNVDATITVSLSFVHSVDVTVTFGLTGTADTLDYATTDLPVVIPAGQISTEVDISSIDDFVDEPNETVIIDITGVTNGTESGTQQITITINDNDRPPRVFGAGFGFF